MSGITFSGELSAQALARTFAHVAEWLSVHDALEPVSEEDVVEIVAQYEGCVDAEPFDLVVEPVSAERRKLNLVSVS